MPPFIHLLASSMKLRLPLHAATALVLGTMTVACAQAPDPARLAAESGEPAAQADLETVRDRVTQALPEIRREDIHPAGASGLYEIQQGSLYGYVTGDGKYLIEGDLIDLASRTSLTENKRKADRIARIEQLGRDSTITFAPKNPKDIKYTVTVFTDIDCGYCRKLHREIEDYTKLGIAIRYAFYPRSGPNSESFRKAEAVWCAEDRKAAMTQAKQGAPMTGNSECPNPVQAEWQLGSQLGLRGTPMLILPDGEVVNGYVPAAALAERLSASDKS